MVDSTGVNTAAAAGTAGESSIEEAPASGASSRSVSQEERSALSSALPSLGTSREDEQHSGHNSDMSDRSSSATGNRKQPTLSRSKSQSQRQWANVRNVMTLYARLRQIKRTKSNQRWMKLRTTVQLSGAIQTIQKKPPLKREDSFLKRFSTRQVPEQQETLDHGDDSEGGNGSGGGLMSTCAAKARRRKKIAQEKRSVVNPDENFYFYWLMLLTVCVLYNLWTLIVRQSFPELQTIIQPIWITCDAFTDIIFLLDILVQFRTGYLEQGLMVYNSKKLAKHYMNSRPFLLDVSSLFPLDLLQFNLGINPILRFPRFLKVYRIYDYYYMVESRTVYPNLWRVINLVHILLILAHWFGCFYFLLSEAEGFQGEWVYPYRPGDYATLARKYLGSLYWSTLTLTTIGDLPTPETNAEYIFTIVSYLIGVFIFATIVGQVGNVITNRNANRLEFERLLDDAKTYMRHHKVPGDMKRRVLRWYDYSWSRGRIQGGGDINTALGLLPDKLKTELALHVNLSVLKKVTIFQECQPEFLHDLVLKMKAYIFTPGDLICRKGEVAREMFIIADGILEVISETGRVLTTMKAGDFFGEIGILNLDGLNKRTADVRSVGYSELFSLSREDVLMAMKDYPEAQEILQSLGRKRLMEARNVNRGGKPSTTKRRVSGTEHAPGNAGDSSDSTGKRIVDKIRCDVKGLKNVLRKSRRSNSRSSKEDSMELQPLTSHSGENQHQSKPPRIKKLLLRSINVESSTSHDSTGSGSGKGHVLRRMGRVHSDEEQHESTTTHTSPPVQNEVIGAGLPLLQRLLMLKAKEDREQRERDEQVQQNRVTSPPNVSTAPVTVTTTAVTSSAPKEVIGAGLPLMTRLRMLKQREDAEAASAKSKLTKPPSPKPTSPPIITKPSSPPVDRKMSSESLKTNIVVTETPVKTAPVIVSAVLKKKPWPILINKKINNDCHDDNNKNISSPKESTSNIIDGSDKPVSPVISTTSLSPPIKSPIIAITSPIIVTTPPLSSPSSTTSPIAISSPPISSPPVTSPTVTSPIIKSPVVTSPPIISPVITSPVSPINITSPPLTSPSSPASITSPPSSSSSSSIRSPKPNLLRIQQDSKFYQSVDDLSPEYSGLPFVKKLKILNERQKLIELEKCVNKNENSSLSIRSSSLDSGNNYLLQSESLPISRSRSETCDIDYVQRYRNINNTTSIDNDDVDNNKEKFNNFKEALQNLRPSSPESPGSNETLERRNLKSILKKLSSSTSEEKSGGESSPVQIAKSKIEFKKLLRAPTVEGYAARHSKFAKSVTFNRETLSPPSGDAITLTNEIPRVNGTSSGIVGGGTTTNNDDNNSKNKLNFILPNLLLPSHAQELRREQEFFTDMMTGMKSVLQNHLEEIQNKFQARFQSLEMEVRRRDEIISQLQSRIQELEGGVNLPIDVNEDRRLVLGGGSEDGDISDQEETNSDQPFMRGDSVDTVVTPSGSPIPLDSSSDEECEMLRSRLEGQDSWEEEDEEEFATRRGILESSTSWEEHSEGESQELLDLPPTLSPQNLWHVSLDVPSSSSSSDSSSPLSSPPAHNEDWEVQMLAAELDRKEQREKLEGELAELTGKSKLSKSELDILDQVLLETERDKHKHKIKNLSFDDDHIPSTSTSLLNKKIKRKRTTSDSGRSIENLLIRGDNLRSSLLRNRLNSRRKTTGEEESAAVKSGIVSWLHKKSNQQQQQQIGKQVLNARSLEEPATSVETPTSRSSSIGHLPPTRVGSIFTLSRLRLSTLSHSIRGFTRPQSTPAASTADPEKAVATITQSCPPSSGQS